MVGPCIIDRIKQMSGALHFSCHCLLQASKLVSHMALYKSIGHSDYMRRVWFAYPLRDIISSYLFLTLSFSMS